MKQAVIYTRVSSREQQQEGFSLEAQSRLLREYADKNDLRVVQTFEDIETAKITGRKQFAKMVDFMRRNRDCRVLLVEKTDRVTRNFRDAVTLEELDIEVHFVKEGQVISKDSKSQATLVYGFNLVMARHYSNNLREEVKKGMRIKAEQGIFPGLAPFGYRNNRAERTIEIDPEDAAIVNRIFTLYASGKYALTALRSLIARETGKKMTRSNVHKILRNRFYVGTFLWGDETYRGSHELFVDPELFHRAQAVMAGHHRLRYHKHEVAFRGLLECAYDGCTLTGDVQQDRYIYYRCSESRGRCSLPRFREQDIAERIGEALKTLRQPSSFVAELLDVLGRDRRAAEELRVRRCSELEKELTIIRNRMDQAYTDKLDGKIPEAFWSRRMTEWQAEEHEIMMSLRRLGRAEIRDHENDARKIFGIASAAHSQYISSDSMAQGVLLQTLCSKILVSAATILPVYRKPFEMMRRRASFEEWIEYLSTQAEPLLSYAGVEGEEHDCKLQDA